MLSFFPASAFNPWDYITQNLLLEIPAGTMYIQGAEMLPRSVKPTEFLLATDHLTTTKIYINNKLLWTFIPNSALARIRIHLYAPPATNQIRVENGIDEPVDLNIVVSYPTAFLEIWARESYEYMNYMLEKTYREMISPWATFFIEYQLPWRNLLPDIQELRILAVRMQANCMFGEFGQDGAVTDFISSFALSTPAILEAKNSALYQPDLFQPVTSGDDVSGFTAHVWFMNICMNRRIAFQKLINNLDCFTPKQVSEDVLIYERTGTEIYRQHIFNDGDLICSVSGLLEYLGCMDRMSAACEARLVCAPSICFFATPADQEVLPPGIGGRFLDSGDPFDGTYGPFDSVYDIDPLTDFWSEAPIKVFNVGGCFDTWGAISQLPQNTDCCMEGPFTNLFTTTVNSSETTSLVTPNHPVYGGGDPGLLANPFFTTLHH